MRWLLALLAVATTALASSDPYPRIWNYRGNSGTGAPYLTGASVPLLQGTVDNAGLRDRGRWMLNTLPPNPWANARGVSRGDVIDTMRLYQPSTSSGRYRPTLAYTLMQSWFLDYNFTPATNDSTFYADYQRNMLANLDQNYLYDVGTHNTHSTYNVNWGSRSLERAQARLFVQMAQKRPPYYDGIFFDFFNPCPKKAGEGANTAYNFTLAGLRDGYSLDSAFCDNVGHFIDTLRATNPRLILIGNVARFDAAKVDSFLALHPLDGELVENFFCAGCNTQTSVAAGLAFVQQASPKYKLLKAEYTSGMTTAQAKQAARFTLGITCLGDGYMWIGDGQNGGGTCQNSAECSPFYDEYSVNAATGQADTSGRYVGWLGQPYGAATQVATGVYVRYFWHGAVLVNTTGSTFTVPLATNWRAITGVMDPTTNNGAVSAGFVVPSKDARFLLPFPSAGYSCPWPDICP